MATNGGLLSLTGGTFDNGNHPITNNGSITGFGTLRTGGLTNVGSVTLTGGVTTVNGDVVNQVGHQIQASGSPVTFSGNVVNNGTFKSTNALLTFTGTYTENGLFSSDPADNFFTDLTVGGSGALVGGLGDRFFVSGDLLSTSTNSLAWQTGAAMLRLAGGDGTHEFSVNGLDFGATSRGFENNFAFGIFSLAAGERLTLLDAGAVGGGLYTRTLKLDGGLAQLSSIASNGLNIYYDLTAPENAYLAGGTFALDGGGSIQPVPEPTALLLLLNACGALGALRPRRLARH
jgi:hypothetical protein